jgi:hypothetical protein
LANPYILLIFTFSLAAELGRINNNTTDSILNMHKNVTVVSKETEDVINLVNMTTGNSTFLGEISINTPINNASNLLGQNLTTISNASASTTTPMMGTISLEKAKEDQTEPDMENDDYNLANEEEIVEKQQKQKPVQGNHADKDSTDKQAVRNTLSYSYFTYKLNLPTIQMNEFMASSEESHVFLYLVILVLLLAVLYLIGQNRKKIIGSRLLKLLSRII